MKEDLYSFYQVELFKNWHNAYQDILSEQEAKKETSEKLSLFKPSSFPHHTKIQVEKIYRDSEYRNILLNEALLYEHPMICENTFLIYDLSDYPDTPYRTLLFSYHEAPQKSYETTTDIMTRLAESLRSPIEWSQLIGKSLGYKQRIPYVAGEFILLPERGYSKRPSSWLALHHAQQVEYDAHTKKVYLYLKYRYQLQVSGEKRSFTQQLDRASNIYAIQNKLYKDILGLSQHTLQGLPLFDKNIVQHHIALHSTEKPKFTFYEYFQYLIFYLSNQQFQTLFSEDNPYFEEVQNRFNLF